LTTHMKRLLGCSLMLIALPASAQYSDIKVVRLPAGRYLYMGLHPSDVPQALRIDHSGKLLWSKPAAKINTSHNGSANHISYDISLIPSQWFSHGAEQKSVCDVRRKKLETEASSNGLNLSSITKSIIDIIDGEPTLISSPNGSLLNFSKLMELDMCIYAGLISSADRSAIFNTYIPHQNTLQDLKNMEFVRKISSRLVSAESIRTHKLIETQEERTTGSE